MLYTVTVQRGKFGGHCIYIVSADSDDEAIQKVENRVGTPVGWIFTASKEIDDVCEVFDSFDNDGE